MRKITIYADVFARIIILLLCFFLLPIFFLLFIIAQIGQLFLDNLFAFAQSTKQLIATYDNELNSKK